MKATHRLTNVTVERVSLVNRASVRDPSNPTEPMRFLLRKAEKKPKKKRGKARGKRTLYGEQVTEQQLAAMHDRATSGRRGNDQERNQMAKQARETIKKLDAGEPVGAQDISEALATATGKAAAKIRKADSSISEYDARVAVLRKADDDDVRRLQAAYLEATNPAAAEIAAAIAKGERYVPPSTGSDAAVQLRKAAADVKRPGMSDYDAMLEALRRNPELGRYREAA